MAKQTLLIWILVIILARLWPDSNDGKLITSTSMLPAGTPVPRGLSQWTQAVLPRMFKVDPELSHFEQRELVSRKTTFEVSSTGGTLVSGGSYGKLPSHPQTSEEYFELTQRQESFMAASGRWNASDLAGVRKYVRSTMALFAEYPFKNVLLYDEDFRLKRHLLQDRNWTTRDSEIFGKRITVKSLKQCEQAASIAESCACGDTHKTPSKTSSKSPSLDLARPCYRKLQSSSHGSLCARWNWSTGCIGAPASKTGDKCDNNRPHLCSFCADEHRVQDCQDYLRLHPDDAKRGYNG